MHPIDWLIVAVPLLIVTVVAFKSRRYVKGVSDFLVAGRVAGRYVVAVASGEATMGLISAVGIFEMYYRSGFAYGFWGGLSGPISLLILLTGLGVYRFRETRAMTMGQFFEIRYSKRFRVFAGVLQSISGIVNYALFPAVGARFVVYFCDLPANFQLFNMMWPTYGLLMAIFLAIAVVIVSLGGQITVMVTDCIQGILSYPLYLLVVLAIIWQFSWNGQIIPTLLDRPPGQSMLNPYDIIELRDFNLFYIMVGLIASVYNMLAWSGIQGYTAAAISAHEQKMGKILGSWRAGFSGLMFLLIAVSAYTYMNHVDFADKAADTNRDLIHRTMEDIIPGERFATVRGEINEYTRTGEISPSLQSRIDRVRVEDAESARKQDKNEDEIEKILHPEDPTVAEIAVTGLKDVNRGKAQVFETIRRQMRVPSALRDILPIGIMGACCAIMVFLMISTDTTYLHSWGSILVQDIVLPFRKKPFTPRQQLFWLRIAIAFVALFAFIFSLKFGQITLILMYFALTGAIWMGGAGIVIMGGLYYRRGTAAGAWTGLITGSSLAALGFFSTKYWVSHIYPWLEESPKVLLWVTKVFERISDPFRPIVDWYVTSDKFFMNGQEVYFITIATATTCYVVVSLLTCRKPFNMERMLHRGEYRRKDDDSAIAKPPRSPKELLLALLGITSEFTWGDKILSWSVFIWSMVTGISVWVTIVVWNAIKEGGWPNEWWATWFSIQNLIIPCIVGVVTTVWFTIGGTLGLRQMFRRLAAHEVSALDDGRVVDHVSADDISLVEEVDHTHIDEAHEDESESQEPPSEG